MLGDDGLQPERTDLAWRRTALGYFVNAALIARFGRDTELGTLTCTLAAASGTCGAGALVHARRLYADRGTELLAGGAAARSRPLLMLSLATIGLAIVSLALTIAVLA